MKKLGFLTGVILSSIPVFASANIAATNNTNAPATVHVGSTCSNIAGDKGILKPHETVKISQDILRIYCSKSCTVHVFMSKNCGGHEIASAKVDEKDGIISVTNHNVGGYYVTSTDRHSATVNGGPSK